MTKHAPASELSSLEPEVPQGVNSRALDRLYAAVARSRRRWFERHPEARRRLLRPVISVGNLSVGGTGKTPLTMAIAAWFLTQGERPAILSRGYKRADLADGVVVVSDGERVLADLSRAGDEPLMMARAVPRSILCVAEERHLAGVVAERRLGATVHILDDGFQHVQLARDLDVLVTSPGEITKGRTLPSGRMREPRNAAARADFVVVVDADTETARTEAWELGVSGFAAARRRLGSAGAPGAQGAQGAVGPQGAVGAQGETQGEVGARAAADAADPTAPCAPGAPYAPGAPGLAVTGIGHPEQFFGMLRDAGYQVESTMVFADHHRYTVADVAQIDAALRAARATVVLTTEKDAVRFYALGTLPFTLIPIAMRLEVDGWDGLTAALDHAVRRARGLA